MNKSYRFRMPLWEYGGSASWFFVSLPEELADEIEASYGQRAAGFGSLRVEVTVGRTTWATSIFPDSKRGTYILPVKKAVRKAEGLDEGVDVDVALKVIA